MPRVTSAKEIFDNLSQYFVSENSAGVNTSFQFNLSGEGGGHWGVVIAEGAAKVSEGTLPSPGIVVEASAADWVGIIDGDLNPMGAFMQGKIRVSGDLTHALKLQTLFRRPQ